MKGRAKQRFVNDKLEADNRKPTGRAVMRQGFFSWVRVCAGMLAALLEASAAQAATPCVEPPAEAGFPPVTLQQIAQGLREPVHIAVAPDGSGRLYVVEQAGVVRVVERGQVRPEPFLDIRSQVESGGEKGLLSIAFHPRYRDNGLFFLDYTASDAAGLHTRISRWRRATTERADPKNNAKSMKPVALSRIRWMVGVKSRLGNSVVELFAGCPDLIERFFPDLENT
jgi:glucose/arabinose dehydrogenase